MAKIRRLRRLGTVAEIVEAYDRVHGRASFRRLIERSKQQVTNYKSTNHLPADTFLIATEALKGIGCYAPPAIWGIKEPARARAA